MRELRARRRTRRWRRRRKKKKGPFLAMIRIPGAWMDTRQGHQRRTGIVTSVQMPSGVPNSVL